MQAALPALDLSKTDLMTSRSFGSAVAGPFQAASNLAASGQVNWDFKAAENIGRYLAVQQEILRQQAQTAPSPVSIPALFFPAAYPQQPMFPILERSQHLWAAPATAPENALQKMASKSLSLPSDSRPPVSFLPRRQSFEQLGFDFITPATTVTLNDASKTPSNSPIGTMSNSSRSTGATLVASDTLGDFTGRFPFSQLWNEVVAGSSGTAFQGSPDSVSYSDLAPDDLLVLSGPSRDRRASVASSGSDFSDTHKRKAPSPAKRARKSKQRQPAPSNLRQPDTAYDPAPIAESGGEKISAHALNRAANEVFGCGAADLTPAQVRKCRQQILIKRSRNTEAARRSRGKRREHVEEMETRLAALRTENDGLRIHILELEGLMGVRR
jgi:hypothetical protein